MFINLTHLAQEEVINTQGVAELAKNNFIYTSMVTAIAQGNVAMLDVVLSKTAASVNASGRNGNNLLLYAAMWGQYDTVLYLLKNGADVSVRNEDGDSALTLARKNGHSNVAVLLREYGAR